MKREVLTDGELGTKREYSRAYTAAVRSGPEVLAAHRRANARRAAIGRAARAIVKKIEAPEIDAAEVLREMIPPNIGR